MIWLIEYVHATPAPVYLAASWEKSPLASEPEEAMRFDRQEEANAYIRRYGLGGAWSVRKHGH